MSSHPDKLAIVTGASRGLGAAIAASFAQDGIGLVLVARDAEALERNAARARELGAPVATCIEADLSRPEAAPSVIDRAIEAHGRIDILVNNAGDTKRGDFLTLTDEDFHSGFELKFHGCVRLCRAAWPHLQATRGCIVNIAGIGAHSPEADFTIGGPVNSALINFTKALAKRAIADGIRINTVCPGHIVTDRLRRRIETRAATRKIGFDEAKEEMRKSLEIRRFGEAEEVANVISFVCSDRGAYVHGTTLDVDGGARPGI